MKTKCPGNIYSIALGILVACASPSGHCGETDVNIVSTPSDTVVAPAAFKRGKAGKARIVLVDNASDLSRRVGQVLNDDTLPAVFFRVQLITSKLYGDAAKSVRVARELCDAPITLDYDVPYYKVRSGAFATRAEAEASAVRAKSFGFKDAWVVIVAGMGWKSSGADTTRSSSAGTEAESR